MNSLLGQFDVSEDRLRRIVSDTIEGADDGDCCDTDPQQHAGSCSLRPSTASLLDGQGRVWISCGQGLCCSPLAFSKRGTYRDDERST